MEELEGTKVEDTAEDIVEVTETQPEGKKAVLQFTVTAYDDATVGIGLEGENNLWVIRGILAAALTQTCNVSINKVV